MEVSKVAVTLSRSIKMAEYQYYKPEVMIEVSLQPGEDPKEAYNKAYRAADICLKDTIKREYDAFGM